MGKRRAKVEALFGRSEAIRVARNVSIQPGQQTAHALPPFARWLCWTRNCCKREHPAM